MKKLRIFIFIFVVAGVCAGVYYQSARRPTEIALTGIVTTDDIIVSSQMQGRLLELRVKEGDTVTKDELLAVIDSQQQEADVNYYTSLVQQDENQIKQSESDLENTQLVFERSERLFKVHGLSAQDYDQARTSYAGAQARVAGLKNMTEAAEAQKVRAQVQLSYTRITAPAGGIVDTRTALQGEVVNIGQPIVTIINPDDLWVRADVEETYIDSIHLGDRLMVKLPSGALREGTVFYRGIDADYATQRDVSRTKRDIRTFEIRLRCDNADRALAVGMTAYVTLPLQNK